jgi:hypothetical protein
VGLGDTVRYWMGRKLTALHTSRHVVHGLPVVVVNTRPDIATDQVLARLDRVLTLISTATPHYYRHLERDVATIRVQRYACRGAYFPSERACLVELTFAVNPAFSDAQVAASLVHEAMHARLDCLGLAFPPDERAREERFCRRAEIEFGLAVPDGAAVVERALAALRGADDEVAPIIDPSLAAERIDRADVEAASVPAWMKRAIARRRGWTH